MSAPPAPRYSLVVPCHNEAGNIGPLLRAAGDVLDRLADTAEILVVDDGSTDATAAELRAAALADPRCRVITLPENRGQAAALWLGLCGTRGEILLTMDGDGQNDPGDFPALLQTLAHTGADLVCGWRRKRDASLGRRLISRVGNLTRRAVLRDGVRDAGCQLRVFRRAVLERLTPGPMLQAFLPAQAVAAGFRLVNLPVADRPRLHGRTHYGWGNLWFAPARELARAWRQR
jgi:glycosyltransferase involved in cell wall biosynthesis